VRLIVGLGNPGKKYQNTRHNLGFLIIDKLRNYHFKNLILLKPQTFMNESGSEVLQKANYFKIKPQDIWVICDDINLPLGQMRIKEEGSSGGHKGLQSIIDELKTEDFPRIRVGIGLPEPKIPAEDYVLQNFSALEKKEIDKTIDQVAEIIVKLENNK